MERKLEELEKDYKSTLKRMNNRKVIIASIIIFVIITTIILCFVLSGWQLGLISLSLLFTGGFFPVIKEANKIIKSVNEDLKQINKEIKQIRKNL